MYSRRLLLTLLVLVCGNAEAQDPSAPAPERVRYWRVSDGRQVQTRLVSQSDTSITVVDPVSARIVEFTSSDVRNVSLYHGRNPLLGLAKGTLLGAGVGAVIGGIIGASEDPTNSWFVDSRAEGAMLAGVAFGVVGGTVGAVIGLVGAGERWSRIPLRESGVRLSVSGRGVGVRVPLGR